MFRSREVLRTNALKVLKVSEDGLVECGLSGDMLLDAGLLPDLLRKQDLLTLAVTAQPEWDEKKYGPKALAALNARSRPDVIAKARPTINQKDSDGYTPLHRACRSIGDLELAATLLLAGADINTRNSDNDAPLHWASINRDLDIVRLLLEWGGVEVNARASDGYTPLGEAISEGRSEETVALLRAKGATE